MTRARAAQWWIARSGLLPIVVLAMYVAALVFAGYQRTATYRLDIAQGDRNLIGFYDREQTPQLTYRWTSDNSAIRLPAMPRGRYTVTLGVVAPRPTGGPPPNVEIAVDDAVVTHFTVGPDYQHRTFTMTLPLDSTGARLLQFHSETFIEPPPERRTLGIIVSDLSLTPVQRPLVPPLAPWLAFVADALIVYGFLRLRWSCRMALIAGVGAATGAAALCALARKPFAETVDRAFLPFVCVAGVLLVVLLIRRRTANPVWTLGAAAATLLAGASAASYLYRLNGTRHPTDFGIFYRAAAAVWTRQPGNLYDLRGLAADPLLGVIYRQPPFPAVLIAPLSRLSFDASLFLWRVLLVGCVVAGVGLLARELRLHAIGAPPGWPLLALTLLTLVWLPLRESIVGQWDALLLLLLVLALIGLRRGRPALVGVTIGLAATIKIYPLYLTLFLIGKRQWRALGWLLATLVALTLIGVLGVGWDTTVLYLRHVLPAIGGSTTYAENQSLAALFLRLFRINAIQGPWVTVATALGLLLATVPLCWRLRAAKAPTSLGYAADFSLTICAMLLAIPVAWSHYEVVLLVPVGVLLAALASSRSPALGWLAVAAVAVAFLAFGQDALLGGALHLPLGQRSYLDKTFVVSAAIFAQLGLAIALWYSVAAGRAVTRDHLAPCADGAAGSLAVREERRQVDHAEPALTPGHDD